MNNKDFVQALSKKIDSTSNDTQDMVQSLISVMTKALQDEGGNINIQGFGAFEVKKRFERISVNPTTQQRMLIPPKLTLSFRPSSKMKEQLK